MYKWNGTRLTSNYAIEDYASRRRQLADGLPDPVDSPAIAPWDTLVGARNVDAELTVQRWLVEPGADLSEVAFDDEPAGTSSRLIDFETTVVDDCFSAGDAVAFHVTQTGTAAGRAATLYSVGIVHVDAAQRLSGHVVRERVALQRALAEGPLA